VNRFPTIPIIATTVDTENVTSTIAGLDRMIFGPEALLFKKRSSMLMIYVDVVHLTYFFLFKVMDCYPDNTTSDIQVLYAIL